MMLPLLPMCIARAALYGPGSVADTPHEFDPDNWQNPLKLAVTHGASDAVLPGHRMIDLHQTGSSVTTVDCQVSRRPACLTARCRGTSW
jgi:hypothetical protein